MAKVVWIVNHYAGLPNKPGGTRHYWLSRRLQELGWDVRLIRSGVVSGDRRGSPVIEDIGGVEVTTFPGWGPEVRGVTRIRDWAAFTERLLFPRATRHLPRPAVVIGSTVHLGAAWAARNLARRHEAAFVFEVRDLWPETLIAMGVLARDSVPARSMWLLERSLARSASIVVSPLSGVGDYMLHQHGIPKDKFLWVSNGVNVTDYSSLGPPPENGLRLQYLGAIGRANDVGSIVDAVDRANSVLDRPVVLQIQGSGPDRDELTERVRRHPRLSSVVTFPEPVPSHQLPMSMTWGNVVIFTIRDLPDLYRYGVSMNKMFDYLASRRWIIMGSRAPLNPIAAAPGLTVCDPTELGLSEAIVHVAKMDSSQRNHVAMGNALLARERFDYRVLASQLAVALDRVVARA